MSPRLVVLAAVLLGLGATPGGAQTGQREIAVTFDDRP